MRADAKQVLQETPNVSWNDKSFSNEKHLQTFLMKQEVDQELICLQFGNINDLGQYYDHER